MENENECPQPACRQAVEGAKLGKDKVFGKVDLPQSAFRNCGKGVAEKALQKRVLRKQSCGIEPAEAELRRRSFNTTI